VGKNEKCDEKCKIWISLAQFGNEREKNTVVLEKGDVCKLGGHMILRFNFE